MVRNIENIELWKEDGRTFWSALYIQNLYLNCAHGKFYQAAQLKPVQLSVCKLFLNKNNIIYIKRKKPSLNKNPI